MAWEYLEMNVRRDNLSLVMNKQGENGWELVSVFPDPSCNKKQRPAYQYQLIFKREIIESSIETNDTLTRSPRSCKPS